MVFCDVLPRRGTATDRQRAFGLKSSRFWELVAAGQFDAFELSFRIGNRRAWSGALVQRYLAGEAIPKRPSVRPAVTRRRSA